MQLCSAALYSLGHGSGNDAQKTMGIIAGLLYAGRAISAMTSSHFGWSCRIKLPSQRAPISAGGALFTQWDRRSSPEPARDSVRRRGATTLFLATWLGVPVSTTHTITGAIIGVGAARKVSAVRWGHRRQHCYRVGDHAAGGGRYRRFVLRQREALLVNRTPYCLVDQDLLCPATARPACARLR